jgi:hypothetical protein
MVKPGLLQIFEARHGTRFIFRQDLTGEIYVQTKCVPRSSPVLVTDGAVKVATMQVDAEDFLEFVAHVAELPPWSSELDEYDKQTRQLMAEHVARCTNCELSGIGRCADYFRLILARVREKEERPKT